MSKSNRESSKLLPAPLDDQLSLFAQLSPSDGSQSWTFETDRLLSYRLGKRTPVDSMDADVQRISVNGQFIKVLRSPGVLNDTKGKSTLIFPSDREYWIEKAIRKLAIQQSIPVTLLAGQGIQVVFTIYILRKELAESGHFYTVKQIKESLKILAGSRFEIVYENREKEDGALRVGTLLENLSMNYRLEGDQEGKKSFVRCTYHEMVAQSIRAELHHPINHERQMRLKNTLASWFVDRINQVFRQAAKPSIMKASIPYHIALTTILRESGMIEQELQKNNLRTVRKALQALSMNGYLDLDESHPTGWIEKSTIESTKGRPKITEIIFELFLSYEFAEEIIEGNIQKKKMRELSSQTPLFKE